jgi:hypothetical protein
MKGEPPGAEQMCSRVHLAPASETAMSDRITWGICPTCGSRATIVWEVVTGRDGEPVGERPVQLICAGGCDITEPQQLAALQE